MAANEPCSLLNLAEIKGRGRALVAAQPLRGGQVVIRDSPILLYSALPLTTQSSPSSSSSINNCYCDNCFKILPQSPSTLAVSCPACSRHVFCSSDCLSAAISASHTPWVCQALSCLVGCGLLNDRPLERHVQVRFLVAAFNLAVVSPSSFQTLLSLQGREASDNGDTVSAAKFLHSLIASVCPPPLTVPQVFSLEMIVALLSKDKLNAFGLMEPISSQEGNAERSVRAYGIYPRASFFNHDCLPNACRFDYLDTASDSNTDIIVRMIHDVPQGREICLSYFPVNLNYSTRQKRLMEDYGFACVCDRCKVEANWSDNENDDGNNGEDDAGEGMEEDVDEQMDGLNSEEDIAAEAEADFPHAYFFVRFMCNRKNCGGTMAPLPPSNGAPSKLSECNMCGMLRNADEETRADTEEEMDE